jgi:SPX domain protein involved in polyphosphate accumulation
MQASDKTEELRYERKFLISEYSFKEVEQLLKFHPAAFSEIYHERIVNNIYFDNLAFDSYYHNVEGEKDRMKIRIRWYGELSGTITKPVLEYKIKKGLLGTKKSYALQPFVLDADFSKRQIETACNASSLPKHVSDHLLSLTPALMNRYSRKYYMSADKNFRITIDHHLSYYRIGYDKGFFPSALADHSSVILELKYDSSLAEDAVDLGNLLPFTMTKNSKYLQGLERTLF